MIEYRVVDGNGDPIQTGDGYERYTDSESVIEACVMTRLTHDGALGPYMIQGRNVGRWTGPNDHEGEAVDLANADADRATMAASEDTPGGYSQFADALDTVIAMANRYVRLNDVSPDAIRSLDQAVDVLRTGAEVR